MAERPRVLLVSDDSAFAASTARALERIGIATRRAAVGAAPDPSAGMVLLDVAPASFADGLRWLRTREGRYAAATGDRLGRDQVRGLYAEGLVRYLRRSASPERVAACLAGDAARAALLDGRARRAEEESRRPRWRRSLGRMLDAVVPRGPERAVRVAAFSGLSVVAGLLLAAGLQSAAETATAVERLERRRAALQKEAAAAAELRPAAPPASPPWAVPGPGTRRPD